MAFDNKYPYTDFHELNLDWVLEQVTGLDDRFDSIEEAINTLRRETVENIQRIDGDIRSINETIRLINADIADLIVQWRQVAPDFDETVVYHQDNYVFHNGILYRRKENTPETAGAWNPSYWEHVTIADRLWNYDWSINTLTEQGSAFSDMFDELSASIGPEYNSESTYLEWELVMYNQVLYKASQAVPVGMDPINHPEYWTADSVVTELHNIPEVDYPEISISGEPSVTLRDAVGNAAKSVYVSFLPAQSGSGVPSPINVRQITGRSSVTVNDSNGMGEQTSRTANFDHVIYGGNYDFVSGAGFEEWVVVDMGDINYTYYNNAFRFRPSNGIISGEVGSEANDYLCSCYPNQSNTVISASNLEDMKCAKTSSGTACSYYFKNSNYTTVEEFKTAMSGYNFAYKLAAPTPITLSPATIDLFKGFNIVWTDADRIYLTYEYLMQYPVYQTGTDVKIGVTGDGKAVMLREIVETGLPAGTNNISGLFDWTEVESILSVDGCVEGEQTGITSTIAAAQTIARPSGDGEFYINAMPYSDPDTSYTLKLLVTYIAE